MCPKCGAMVRVAASVAAVPPKSTPRASSSSIKKPGRIEDLEALHSGELENFAPPETQLQSDGSSNFLHDMDPRVVYGIGAGLALVLLFGLYVLFRPTTPDATTLVPASVNRPSPAPAPLPVPQDVVKVDSPQQPAPRPIVLATTNATSRPSWMGLVPVAPKLAAKPITDQLVEQSIKRAVAFLKTQISGSELINPEKTDLYSGQNTLVVYSLLHASEAIDDSELSISSPLMQGLLNRLKQFDMSKDFATYDRSLRASALAMFLRDADKQQLRLDKEWLLKSEMLGAYDYSMPAPGSDLAGHRWDNSNSQYGVLGIWAAIMAGDTVPDKYWSDVEQHWLTNQDPDGGWGYQGPGGGGTITMTCAGVTTLCVTAEQQELISSKGKRDAHPQMSAAVNKALDWMGKEDHLTNFNGGQNGYALYGVERAALATGFRWFGNHDWFRELGARELKDQAKDGSWGYGAGGAGAAAETAFRVLFLSRGRQPLFMDKLRFNGDWNDRPRDVSKMTQYASAQLEKPFSWGVADLSRDWWDWLESPVLFMSTDTPPSFSDDDCKKLRSYTDAGGMLFIHNEYASKDVDQFVSSLAQRLYPEYKMMPVASDDLLYSTVFPMKTKPPLMSVGNGTRTFMVYSPKDITEAWVRFKPHDNKQVPSLQLGLNLFVAAAGKTDFRNRLSSPYEEPCDFDPVGTVPVLQIAYPGPWNAEPRAYERFGRWFEKQTSIRLGAQPATLLDINSQQGPVAVLSGNAAVDFSKMDFHALHDYVADGGVLVIDATGGSKAFADSIRQTFLPTAFPGVSPTGLPGNHPILAGSLAFTDGIQKPHLKNYASGLLNGVAPNIQYANVDKGTIIISELDITTGLLNSGTFGIYGYSPAYDQSLMKNVILWALSRYQPAALAHPPAAQQKP